MNTAQLNTKLNLLTGEFYYQNLQHTPKTLWYSAVLKMIYEKITSIAPFPKFSLLAVILRSSRCEKIRIRANTETGDWVIGLMEQ